MNQGKLVSVIPSRRSRDGGDLRSDRLPDRLLLPSGVPGAASSNVSALTRKRGNLNRAMEINGVATRPFEQACFEGGP